MNKKRKGRETIGLLVVAALGTRNTASVLCRMFSWAAASWRYSKQHVEDAFKLHNTSIAPEAWGQGDSA
jgi:hypothetical protein